MLVWAYTCQNATSLEITCHGSFILEVLICCVSQDNSNEYYNKFFLETTVGGQMN